LLVQRKVTKRSAFSTAEWLVKHTPPPRPSGARSRRDFLTRLPVAAENDALVRYAAEPGAFAARRMPARRGEAVLRLFPASPCTSPLRGYSRRLRRCGRGPGNVNGKIMSNSNGGRHAA
jgi:hypothetical protein